MDEDIDEYLDSRKHTTKNKDSLFATEVACKCPLCGKFLFANKNGKKISLYQIAHIYPNSPTNDEKKELIGLERLGENSESFENKIALCKDCHGKYDDHKTKEEYLKLLDIKKKLLQQTEIKKMLANQNIKDEIQQVIQSLSEFKGKMVPLELKALKISDKIEKSEFLLKNKVESNVRLYFLFIRQEFQNLSSQGKDNFEIISSQIHTSFLLCNNTTNNKSEIFDYLCDWLKTKVASGFKTEAIEAIVSFFVQNCEVFNEITQ